MFTGSFWLEPQPRWCNLALALAFLPIQCDAFTLPWNKCSKVEDRHTPFTSLGGKGHQFCISNHIYNQRHSICNKHAVLFSSMFLLSSTHHLPQSLAQLGRGNLSNKDIWFLVPDLEGYLCVFVIRKWDYTSTLKLWLKVFEYSMQLNKKVSKMQDNYIRNMASSDFLTILILPSIQYNKSSNELLTMFLAMFCQKFLR